MTPMPQDDMLRVPAEEKCWVVLHTRPRCEKKVVDYCRRSDIPVYLPLQNRVHRYGGRKRSFSSPLFPGYAFAVVERTSVGKIRQNRYVANVLLALDQALLVSQLRQIRKALDVGDVMEVMPYLKKGKAVRVRSGPFKGLEGVVALVKGTTRVVVNVDMIQRAIALEVDPDMLTPA